MNEEKFPTFLFSYRHEGYEWVFEIKARDAQDAKARLAKLSYATYDGELMTKIPVPRPLSGPAAWLARLIGGRPAGQTRPD
jgi:hypothetical protein